MSSTKSKHLQAVIFRYLYCPTVGTEHLSSYFFNLTESILNFTGRRKLRKERNICRSLRKEPCALWHQLGILDIKSQLFFSGISKDLDFNNFRFLLTGIKYCQNQRHKNKHKKKTFIMAKITVAFNSKQAHKNSFY